MDAAAQMMSTVVRMEGYSAADTLGVVQEIRESGLVQGQDFDFAYHPPVYHDRAAHQNIKSVAEFRFYTQQYATMFKLKYL
jgi:hypothetical protein